ncbi:hypothetical protein AC579_3632 [Pseudocercospora musae]|uniref:Uncharacterized protein n=1 Tax=Pseudocercospora musae TaxID=113226 RepID=A0A139ISS3_9PEZI|nr:hypothetical protein AC579_3632 [Pseudocercospora musae]
MRFSTLAALFALTNCDMTAKQCILGNNEAKLWCSGEHPCKQQGNGCIPHDRDGDGRYDYANCS